MNELKSTAGKRFGLKQLTVFKDSTTSRTESGTCSFYPASSRGRIPMCGEYVLDSCAAELTEEETEELTALCEPPDGEYSDVAKRPQLTTKSLKKHLYS
jgi:hypothetical protein